MDRETTTQHNRIEELAVRIVSDSLRSAGLRRLASPWPTPWYRGGRRAGP